MQIILYHALVAISADGSTVYVTTGSARNNNTKDNIYSYDNYNV